MSRTRFSHRTRWVDVRIRGKGNSMLVVRRDWQCVTSGAVVKHLVDQVRTTRMRNEVACHLVGASLDLVISTWPRRGQPPLVLETVSRTIWRISSLYYIYLRVNDDRTLNRCIRLARSETVTVIMPRRYGKLKRRLLTGALGQRTPVMWSLDEFISYRTLFPTIDQGWPRNRAILELLKAYNRRVNAVGCSDALLVQSPEEIP